MFDEADPVQHPLGDRARSAKEVERDTRRGAVRDRSNCLLELRGIDVAVENLLGVVLAVDSVDVPEPVAAADREVPVERCDAVVRVDALAVAPWSDFIETALDLKIILTGHKIDAKRVERVGCRNSERVENI